MIKRNCTVKSKSYNNSHDIDKFELTITSSLSIKESEQYLIGLVPDKKDMTDFTLNFLTEKLKSFLEKQRKVLEREKVYRSYMERVIEKSTEFQELKDILRKFVNCF